MEDSFSDGDMRWLKEGLAFTRRNVDYPYDSECPASVLEDSKIARIKGESGRDITPRPVFPVFLKGLSTTTSDSTGKRKSLEKVDGQETREGPSDSAALEDMSEGMMVLEKKASTLPKRDTMDNVEQENKIEDSWYRSEGETRVWKTVLSCLLGADVTDGEESISDEEMEKETKVEKKETADKQNLDEISEIEDYQQLLESVDPKKLTRSLSKSDPFASLVVANEKERAERERKRLEAEHLKNLTEYYSDWDRAIQDLKHDKPIELEEIEIESIVKTNDTRRDHSTVLTKMDLPTAKLTHFNQESIEFSRKDIILRETDTFILLDIPNTLVLPDSDEYRRVAEMNAAYQDTLKNYELEKLQHHVGVQCSKPIVKDSSCGTDPLPLLRHNEGMIDELLYHQTYFEEDVEQESVDEDALVKKVEMNDVESLIKYLKQNQDEFLPVLHFVEKALNKNNYSELISACIGTEAMNIAKPASDVLDKPRLKHLLTVKSDTARGKHPVTCICFNFVYPYYFAAGFDTQHEQLDSSEVLITPGYIICWDIRHFQVPEITFNTPEVVRCLEFSKTSPYLLAAGMCGGFLAIFDISQKNDKPQVDNFSAPDRPFSDISRLSWSVSKEQAKLDTRTVITCTSHDGMLYQWFPGAGARGTVLSNQEHAAEEETVDLSSTVSDPYLCLDLKPTDCEVCVVGCLTGDILQSNIFGQTKLLHQKHTGPVYEVKWSPFVDDVFISCGFDSSVCLWEASKNSPSRIFIARENQPVLHVDWSHTSSTLFGAITGSKIKVFDLSLNRVNELIERQLQFPDEKYTCIAFFPHGNWFFVGRTDGVIDVFDVLNVPVFHEDTELALKSAFFTE